MLRFVTITMLFLIAAFAATIQTGYAQEEYSMEEMMALAQPGPEHTELANFAGDWKIEMKFNMEMKPGGQMSPSAGVSTVKPILGGRFMEFTNDMDFMGMKARSMQVIGYDRRFDKYVFFGIDEMGTYYITAEGTFDERTGEFSMLGIDTWPTKDGGTKDQKYTMVYTFPKDGAYTFKVLFESEDGTIFDMVTGKATRK